MAAAAILKNQKNRHIWAAVLVLPISTKFGMVTQANHLDRSHSQILERK